MPKVVAFAELSCSGNLKSLTKQFLLLQPLFVSLKINFPMIATKFVVTRATVKFRIFGFRYRAILQGR